MTWTITKDTVVVTMPVDPETLTITYAKNIKAQAIYADYPFIFEMGAKPRVLVIKGWIFDAGKSKDQLYTEIVSKLKDWAEQHGLVTLDFLGTRYDGSYRIVKFQPVEKPGFETAYYYTMELWYKGFGE